MIAKVHAKNFQSLTDSTVELGTLTVILGANDLGKSALFRAIRALVETRSGDDFITHGKDKAQVSLTLDTGETITWTKGKQVNRYDLHDQSGNIVETWERAGRETPHDLADTLSMGPISFDEDLKLNINFADQEDPPFLVPYPGGITPSNVAKVLGDLTNLNLLFKAVAQVDRERKQADGAKRLAESALEQAQAQLAALPDLQTSFAALSAAHALIRDVEALESQLETLRSYEHRLRSMRRLHDALDSSKPNPLDPDVDILIAEAQAQSLDLSLLRGLRTQGAGIQARALDADQRLELARKALEKSEKNLKEALELFPECPTCGRPMATV